jgi:hypothetical protein
MFVIDLAWVPPVKGMLVAVGTLATTLWSEWGWKRRRELRDELRAQLDEARVAGVSADSMESRRLAFEYLNRDLADAGIVAAQRRARRLTRRSGWRSGSVVVSMVFAGILLAGVPAYVLDGLTVRNIGMMAVCSLLGGIYLAGAIIEIRDRYRAQSASPELRELTTRVSELPLLLDYPNPHSTARSPKEE